MSLYAIALILFVLTALGGLVLVAMRARGRNPPIAVALLHGAIGAGGLVALLIGLLRDGWPPLPTAAFVVLVLAALGGFAVFAQHLRGRLIPMRLTVIHAVVGVAGVLLLVIGLVAATGTPPARP